MNQLIGIAIDGLVRATLTQFIQWQAQKAKDAAWKPSDKDVEDFLVEISKDTPEALKAQVAAALGMQWPPAEQ